MVERSGALPGMDTDLMDNLCCYSISVPWYQNNNLKEGMQRSVYLEMLYECSKCSYALPNRLHNRKMICDDVLEASGLLKTCFIDQ